MSDQPRWPIVAGAVVGGALGADGVVSLLAQSRDTHPIVVVRWVVGLAVAHDLLLVPFVLVIGVAVRRFPPVALRPFLAGGLLVSGAVTLVAWPFVRGYGRRADNPSILPRNYAHGLALTLVAVWLTTALVALVAWRRGGDTRPHP